MRLVNLGAVLIVGLAVLHVSEAAQRRVRVRTRPVQAEPDNVEPNVEAEEDSQSEGAIQYYSAEPQNPREKGRVLLVAANDEYNGPYGQPTLRQRADYNIQNVGSRSQPAQARTKEQSPKEPPVQTIRNYNKVNDDGSFTFGYEAADGSFKEETRGTDCVVRGKYGYIDPDGNKREFTYVSGNPCDPNNPEGEEEEPALEEEDENIPQNYPKRFPQKQAVRPIQTTVRPTTTVFQNNYNPYNQENPEEEAVEEENVPYLTPRTQVRPLTRIPQATPATVRYSPAPVTPRPTYRAPAQTQPPATTYRPAIAITQKPQTIQSFPSTTPVSIPYSKPSPTAARRPLDFASEFQKFQEENSVGSQGFKPSNTKSGSGANPIYQSQLVFDPSTGHYDANLYQQLPKAIGDFELNQRIQPYVQAYQPQSSPQLVTIDQLRHQSEPAYARPQIQSFGPTRPPHIQVPQFSQQVYQKSQENLQVVNSQQLFAQQQELAQQQLHQDRIKAAEKQQSPSHRFQFQPIQTRPPNLPQNYYYLQQPNNGGSLGQIDAFLKGQNIEY